MTDLKLFEFCEADWIVAKNLRDAVRCWTSYSGETRREALKNFREVPRERWTGLRFKYDEEGDRTCSFKKRIKEIIDSKEEKPPFFLATSEF